MALHNIVIATALSYFLAQLIKSLIDYSKTKKYRFFGSGGMPSSHSATVSALTFGLYLSEGFTSLFFVALIFSIIVIYDASSVRYQAGLHSKLLNSLVKSKNKPFLNERLGHTVPEIFWGIVLGIVVNLIVLLI
jgi:acid phosphatase family membrane protein YuiD